MKLDPILSKAVRFSRKKNYNEAIKVLESEHNRYYGKFTYYYILGLSYLYSRIYGVALRYLNLAIEQKLRDVNTLLGLAALHLNHGDTDKAVDMYLEVQSIDAGNKIAKKALEIIKKYPGPENISSWIDSGKLVNIFPAFPKTGISNRTIAAGISILVTGAIVLFISLVNNGTIVFPQRGDLRPLPIEALTVREIGESPIQASGAYRYELSSNQVIDEYNLARRLFTEYRDEAARVRLNLIMESNASEPYKNSASILLSYLQTPGFHTLNDRFTYEEIIDAPYIHSGVHVIWRGVPSNLIVGQNSTFFELLIGENAPQIVEGRVSVNYDFATPTINPLRHVEILGRVVLDPGELNGIRIQGLDINQAGLQSSP